MQLNLGVFVIPPKCVHHIPSAVLPWTWQQSDLNTDIHFFPQAQFNYMDNPIFAYLWCWTKLKSCLVNLSNEWVWLCPFVFRGMLCSSEPEMHFILTNATMHVLHKEVTRTRNTLCRSLPLLKIVLSTNRKRTAMWLGFHPGGCMWCLLFVRDSANNPMTLCNSNWLYLCAKVEVSNKLSRTKVLRPKRQFPTRPEATCSSGFPHVQSN